MLVLDDGAAITENVAILELIADREPRLGPGGPLSRTRLIEMLAYLSSELQVAFKPLWHDASEIENAKARETVAERLEFLEKQMLEPYLFGPRFTVADAYRSEEHTSQLQSLMRTSYAVLCLKKKQCVNNSTFIPAPA